MIPFYNFSFHSNPTTEIYFFPFTDAAYINILYRIIARHKIEEKNEKSQLTVRTFEGTSDCQQMINDGFCLTLTKSFACPKLLGEP